MTRGALEQAYRSALYAVHLDAGELLLRIGHCDAFADDRLHREAGCRQHWALVTADNPYSQARPAPRNAEARQSLIAALVQAGQRWIAATHRDSEGRWPDEASCLLIDPPAGLAESLGHRFQQNAVVTGTLGESPQLCWLDRAAS